MVEDVGAGADLVAVRRKGTLAWVGPLPLWPRDGRWSGRQHRTLTPVRRRESESCSVCCSVTDAVTDDTATDPCHAVSGSLQLIQQAVVIQHYSSYKIQLATPPLSAAAAHDAAAIAPEGDEERADAEG